MLTILGLISSALSFIGRLFGFIEKQQDIKAGVEMQKAADLTETVKQDEQAQTTDARVRGMSDSELDDELRKP